MHTRPPPPCGVHGDVCQAAPALGLPGVHTRVLKDRALAHTLRSRMVLAMCMRLILQLKVPGAPGNGGAPLVTPLDNQIQTQRKTAPYFTANRSLLSQPSSFPCTNIGQSRQTPPAQARPAPKCSHLWGARHQPLSCLDRWAPAPEGCAPQRMGTCFLGQQLHPNFNSNNRVWCNLSPGPPLGTRRVKSGVAPKPNPPRTQFHVAVGKAGKRRKQGVPPTCCCWKCRSSTGLISPLVSPLAAPSRPPAPPPPPVPPPLPSGWLLRLLTPFWLEGVDRIVSEADSTIMTC